MTCGARPQIPFSTNPAPLPMPQPHQQNLELSRRIQQKHIHFFDKLHGVGVGVYEGRSRGQGVEGSDLEAVASLLLCSPSLLPSSSTSEQEVSPRLDRSFFTGWRGKDMPHHLREKDHRLCSQTALGSNPHW